MAHSHTAMRVLWTLLLLLPSVLWAQEDVIGELIADHSTPALHKPVIVIDPGHGGKDSGAIGRRQVREKDIVLQISRRLAKELQHRLDAEIVMTRDSDRFITLDGRNHVAVQKKADLFLSIHANAASRPEAHGIEIYYLNDSTDEASSRLAARENKGSRKSLSDLRKILSTLIQTESTELSALLAREIKQTIRHRIATKYQLERLHIKTALFYVLVGSQAPSVLLEIGFVTNPREAKRLSQKDYQTQLSKAIAEGVVQYFEVIKSRKVNL